MNKTMILISLFLILGSCSQTAKENRSVSNAGGDYVCGTYGPNVTLRTNSDLGKIATAFFSTPGDQLSANMLDQDWFLLDNYGSGALMGCQPKTSALAQWDGVSNPRINYYDASGMLYRQDATRFSDSQQLKATLKYSYYSENPIRIAESQQFCYGAVDVKLNHIRFFYQNGKLVKIVVTPDQGCPLQGIQTYAYEYNNSQVPYLPSAVKITNPSKGTQSRLYGYTVKGDEILTVSLSIGSLECGYSASPVMLNKLTVAAQNNKTVFDVNYNSSGSLWTGLVDAKFKWGLFITYNEKNQVLKTLQNTGMPEAQASVFSY